MVIPLQKVRQAWELFLNSTPAQRASTINLFKKQQPSLERFLLERDAEIYREDPAARGKLSVLWFGFVAWMLFSNVTRNNVPEVAEELLLALETESLRLLEEMDEESEHRRTEMLVQFAKEHPQPDMIMHAQGLLMRGESEPNLLSVHPFKEMATVDVAIRALHQVSFGR